MATLLSDVTVDLFTATPHTPADPAAGRAGAVVQAVTADRVLVWHYDPTHADPLTPAQECAARVAVLRYRATLEAVPRHWDVRWAEDMTRPALYVQRPHPRHLDTPPEHVLTDPRGDYAYLPPSTHEYKFGADAGGGVPWCKLLGPEESIAGDPPVRPWNATPWHKGLGPNGRNLVDGRLLWEYFEWGRGGHNSIIAECEEGRAT